MEVLDLAEVPSAHALVRTDLLHQLLMQGQDRIEDALDLIWLKTLLDEPVMMLRDAVLLPSDALHDVAILGFGSDHDVLTHAGATARLMLGTID